MNAEGAPDSESARAISWLVWHDVAAWSVGGRPPKASEPPRYVVRVSVPAGSMNDQKRSEMVTRVTTVLAEVDDDPDRMANEPAAWVHITEVPEGNWGGAGTCGHVPRDRRVCAHRSDRVSTRPGFRRD